MLVTCLDALVEKNRNVIENLKVEVYDLSANRKIGFTSACFFMIVPFFNGFNRNFWIKSLLKFKSSKTGMSYATVPNTKVAFTGENSAQVLSC